MNGRTDRNTDRAGKGKKGNGIGGVVRIVILAFLSLILVVQCARIMMELREDSYSYHATEDNYLRDVTFENYYRIFSNTVDDCELSRKYSETEREIRALGYYYEAASLYGAYAAVGDNASSELQRERMERYRQEAGTYAAETEKIDARVYQATSDYNNESDYSR
ncbi:MAG: hypothetical protein Q4A32_08300 [Lachnospiraceae bacterium]|nr:hypothetical protein [Lachnospiraceae bacterium]